MTIALSDPTWESSTCEPPVRDVLLNLRRLRLHHGGSLSPARVAYRLEGPGDAPVVAVLGGISADRFVATRDGGAPGWWSSMVGPGRAVDTRRVAVLGIDFLGAGDSAGAGEAGRCPGLSTFDQAAVLERVMAHAGIRRLHAVVGASYGGMVALALAARAPQRVRRAVVLSAADRPHPMATAWRSVQRGIVRLAERHGAAREGLALARGLAMATYRSADEFEARFAGEPAPAPGGFRFPVEEYLHARGTSYARATAPAAFLCLSESIDLHRVEPETVHVPVTLIGVRQDQLVPIGQLRALAGRLRDGRLVEIDSVYGHDAFLKEREQLTPLLARALEDHADG